MLKAINENVHFIINIIVLLLIINLLIVCFFLKVGVSKLSVPCYLQTLIILFSCVYAGPSDYV